MSIALALLLLAAADLVPETAARLTLAWRMNMTAASLNRRAAQIAAFEATPVLAGNLVYVITPFNQVIALAPDTGKEQWR